MSTALQTGVVILLLTAAVTKTAQHLPLRVVALMPTADLLPYQPPRPHINGKPGSGNPGGGGDRSPMPASHGALPKRATRQFTPPMAVVANLDPKLTIDPSIVAPPDLRMPEVNVSQFGDPLSKFAGRSNGPGSGGGIGSGDGTGIGPLHGDGFANGGEGSIRSGVYRIGTGISPPALLSKVEPEYSEEARKAKYQGTVLLSVEVDASGRAQNIRVLHSLGLGLDEKAMEAVKKWRFRPGTKDGKPVTVAAQIEVNFRLL
jgi:TonB family protein